MSSREGEKVPVNKSFFSTLETSKSVGKLLPSSKTTTFGLDDIKGPGGILTLKTVDLYFCTRDLKKSSLPWL